MTKREELKAAAEAKYNAACDKVDAEADAAWGAAWDAYQEELKKIQEGEL